MTFLSKEKLTEELNKHPMMAQHLDCMDVFDAINESVVDDVVQIVYCKDCKYGQSCSVSNIASVQCFKWNSGEFGKIHIRYWFCADGERR